MLVEKAPFVNSYAGRLLLFVALFLSSVFADNIAVINVAPYPKEVYAGTAAQQNPETAVTGNLFFHDGYYYLDDATTYINLLGTADIIKVVVTDRLKPIEYKVSTVTGFELQLTPDPDSENIEKLASNAVSSGADSPPPAPALLAKCFLLTKKNSKEANFSWDIKIIEVFEKQPLPADFTSNFLIKQSGNNSNKAVFQNEVIFFVESAENVDIDIDWPVTASGNDQAACQDAVLPTFFVRTDVSRCSASRVLSSFPYLKRMQQKTKDITDKKVSITIQQDSSVAPITVTT